MKIYVRKLIIERDVSENEEEEEENGGRQISVDN